MENKRKDVQKKLDETKSVFLDIFNKNKGKIIGIVVLLVILLNTLWNVMDSKVSKGELSSVKEELSSVKADLAAFTTRLASMQAEVEKGAPDLDAVKADVESIKKASENFEVKLNALIKAEEAKIDVMTKDVESYKAYIEELKGLLTTK